MTISTLKIGAREYIVVPRRDFERLKRLAASSAMINAADVSESSRRLSDPKEKRVAWERVKKRAGLR